MEAEQSKASKTKKEKGEGWRMMDLSVNILEKANESPSSVSTKKPSHSAIIKQSQPTTNFISQKKETKVTNSPHKTPVKTTTPSNDQTIQSEELKKALEEANTLPKDLVLHYTRLSFVEWKELIPLIQTTQIWRSSTSLVSL